MNCPKCDMFTPDTSVKCANCGHVITPKPMAGAGSSPYVGAKPKLSTTWPIFLFLLGLLVVVYLLFLRGSGSGKGTAANAARAGQEVDITQLAVRGKTTIFDFYSEFCPPCRKISPLLEELDKKRDDIVVVKIDINRPNVRGIDWQSPVARQYGLQSIPHFVIFDPEGGKKAEGQDAYRQVMIWITQEGLS